MQMNKIEKMTTDRSMQLLHKYYSLQDREIEVYLKNGDLLKGILSDFSRSDDTDHTSQITHLHLVSKDDHSIAGEDPFGFPEGMIVYQKDIVQIKFSDQSIMKF
jgi:hypothetical protein